MNDVVTGATYRHFKGGLYKVLHLALLEATKEDLVIYEALYDNPTGRVWARPKTDFLAHVRTPDYAGPRFRLDAAT